MDESGWSEGLTRAALSLDDFFGEEKKLRIPPLDAGTGAGGAAGCGVERALNCEMM
jgi:hypothetical protein